MSSRPKIAQSQDPKADDSCFSEQVLRDTQSLPLEKTTPSDAEITIRAEEELKEKLEVDVLVVDWDGEDDPENPRKYVLIGLRYSISDSSAVH